MAITTHAELKTTVANWLNRSDLTSYIPDFITLAEKRIHRDVVELGHFLRGMEKRAADATEANNRYIGLPTDFLSLRSIKLTSTDPITRLEYVTPDKYNQYTSTGTGTPRVFTVIGDEIAFAPIPDAAYTVEMAYYGSIAALSDANTTNWFITNAPETVLYGSLLEAELFLKNDQRASTWKDLYDTALAGLVRFDRASRYPTGGLRTVVG